MINQNVLGFVFILNTNEFFKIEKYMDFSKLVRNLALLNLKSPLIISVIQDVNFVCEILRHFESNADFVIKNCGIDNIKNRDSKDLDSVYKMLNEFLYINFNILELVKTNETLNFNNSKTKIFYFKKIILCYTERVINCSQLDKVSESLIIGMNFKEVDYKHLEREKAKIVRRKMSKFLDDHQLEEFQLDESKHENLGDINEPGKGKKNYKLCLNGLKLQDIQLNITNKQMAYSTLHLQKEEEQIIQNIKYQNQERKFNLIDFYIILFRYSFDNLSLYIEQLTLESEKFKEKYIDLRKNEVKDFSKNLLFHEEKIYSVIGELKSKSSFIENLTIKEDNKKEVGDKLKLFLMKQYFSNLQKKDFSVAIQGFRGKLKEMEMQIKKQITIIEMIKKTIKIFVDDEKYLNLRRINFLLLSLTILQYVFSQGYCLSAWMSMNIKIPFKEYDSVLPFYGMIVLLIAIPLGQLFIFYKYKHLII